MLRFQPKIEEKDPHMSKVSSQWQIGGYDESANPGDPAETLTMIQCAKRRSTAIEPEKNPVRIKRRMRIWVSMVREPKRREPG